MTISKTKFNKKRTTTRNDDEQFWSKNHGVSIKFRLRRVEEDEAEQQIRDTEIDAGSGGEDDGIPFERPGIPPKIT